SSEGAEAPLADTADNGLARHVCPPDMDEDRFAQCTPAAQAAIVRAYEMETYLADVRRLLLRSSDAHVEEACVMLGGIQAFRPPPEYALNSAARQSAAFRDFELASPEVDENSDIDGPEATAVTSMTAAAAASAVSAISATTIPGDDAKRSE